MGHEFEARSGKILEAAVAVHKALGPGFLERIYHKAMEVALRHRNIPVDAQKDIGIFFEDEAVGLHRLDLVVSGEIIVELKAVSRTSTTPCSSPTRVGLLLNFNAPTLVIKRVVL
jgi:GxxExxY protein